MTSSSPAKRHTLTAFDAELDAVRGIINKIGLRAGAALEQAMIALATRDAALAQSVIASDRQIDELERSLEKQVVQTIALRAPMADDLRELIVSIRIGAMLERAGDHAKNIARRAGETDFTDLEAPAALLMEMGRLAGVMIAETLQAHQDESPEGAAAVRRRDAEMNRRFDELTRMLTRDMGEDGRLIASGMQLMFAGKQLERIGDYAANIANSVFYMVKGEHLPDWDKGPRTAGD